MTAFDQTRKVEQRGMEVLLPLLQERAFNGQLVMFNKGALAKYLQQTIGDVGINTGPDRFYTVELKVESRKTKNLFLEMFSNRNLDDRASYAERGINPGWLVKLRADLLWYYFLDTDDLYILALFRLQQWAFGTGDQPGEIWNYPLKRQGKYQQRNETWGFCVPIADIPTRNCVHLSARQIPLFDEAAQ
jgi:hypothetical protein